MAVKDVQTGITPPTAKQVDAGAPRSVTLTTINQLSTPPVAEQDSVSLQHGELRPSQVHQSVRVKVNDAIEATNVAIGATEDIANFITGIAGITEQVSQGDLPPQKVAILEREANALKDEILKAAGRSTGSGVKPLLGDTIRLDIEETIGKALEVILPDDAKNAFGLGDLSLSPREVILNTIENVERARQSIESLRGKLSDGVDSLRQTVLALEVAGQNDEASRSSVRDLDQALNLASDTRGEIREDPKGALGSVGDLAPQAASLLRN